MVVSEDSTIFHFTDGTFLKFQSKGAPSATVVSPWKIVKQYFLEVRPAGGDKSADTLPPGLSLDKQSTGVIKSQ